MTNQATSQATNQPKIAVVIPVFNEEARIAETMEALLDQQDKDFTVVICDNESTDFTPRIVDEFIVKHQLDWQVVLETTKGTGAAADTACRTAITNGATVLARTDADCLPSQNWIATLREIFATTNLQLVGGITHPRTDDIPLSRAKVLQFVVANEVAIWFGRFRPENRSKEFKGPYAMMSGNNLAITASMYEACGGFPRTAIDDVHEDRAILQAVRRITPQYALRRDVRVLTSARRPMQWGTLNTLLWYRNHRKPAGPVDIR